jgi:hypothetical protein
LQYINWIKNATSKESRVEKSLFDVVNHAI